MKLTSLIGKGATDVQTDGVLTAPVWFHYLFKVLTSVGIAFALMTLTPLSPALCGALGGPAFYVLVKLIQLKVGDGDPAHYTFLAHFGDDATDFSCANVAYVCGLSHSHPIEAACTAVATYVVFRTFNRWARPGGYYAK